MECSCPTQGPESTDYIPCCIPVRWNFFIGVGSTAFQRPNVSELAGSDHNPTSESYMSEHSTSHTSTPEAHPPCMQRAYINVTSGWQRKKSGRKNFVLVTHNIVAPVGGGAVPVKRLGPAADMQSPRVGVGVTGWSTDATSLHTPYKGEPSTVNNMTYTPGQVAHPLTSLGVSILTQYLYIIISSMFRSCFWSSCHSLTSFPLASVPSEK